MSDGQTVIVGHDGKKWSVYRLCRALSDTLDQAEVNVFPYEVAGALVEANLISIDELDDVLRRCGIPLEEEAA